MAAPKEVCYDDEYMSQLIGIGENLDSFNSALNFFVRMNYYRNYMISIDELERPHNLCNGEGQPQGLLLCYGEQEINYVFKTVFNTVFKGLSPSCKIKFFVKSLQSYKEPSEKLLDSKLNELFKKITPLFIFCFYIQEFKKLFSELGIEIKNVFNEFLNHYSDDELKKQFEVSKLPKEFEDFNGIKKDLFRKQLKPKKYIETRENQKKKKINVDKGTYKKSFFLSLKKDRYVTDDNDIYDELIKYQINNYLLKNIQNLSYFFLLAVNGQLDLLTELYSRTNFTMSNETENTEKNLLGYLTLLFGHPDVALYLKTEFNTEFNFEKPEPEFFPTQIEIIQNYTKKYDPTTIEYRFFNKILEIRPIEIKDKYEEFDPRFNAGGGKKKKRKMKSNRKHRKSIKKNIKRRKSKKRKTRGK